MQASIFSKYVFLLLSQGEREADQGETLCTQRYLWCRGSNNTEKVTGIKMPQPLVIACVMSEGVDRVGGNVLMSMLLSVCCIQGVLTPVHHHPPLPAPPLFCRPLML